MTMTGAEYAAVVFRQGGRSLMDDNDFTQLLQIALTYLFAVHSVISPPFIYGIAL
jgi:hypothetical protein